jgi:hypothetical protein
MADRYDPTIRERISLALIGPGCWFMNFLRRAQKPGAAITAALVATSAFVGLARELSWPHKSWWASGSVAVWVFFTLYGLTSLGSLFVAGAFWRLLKKPNRQIQFQRAAQGLATLVSEGLELPHEAVGVNIWLIKGMKGFRRLVREASVGVPRNPTPITWTKGKGIIGQAWSRNTIRFADLDEVRALNPTEADWCSLTREERFRLSWSEMSETRRYRAVLAIPLRRHKFGRYRVRGVAAIDLLVPGRALDLNALHDLPEVRAIRRTCEAAFAGADPDGA